MKTPTKEALRSQCAVNYGVQFFGDRWLLAIGARHPHARTES